MPKAKLKTNKTDHSPDAFIGTVLNTRRREDAVALKALFDRVTGLSARMWGSSIIGYGRYEYRYESGREGEFFLTGFSPRKANLVVYIMPGYQDLSPMLERLGKHKLGKSCLYINKLADVDLAVLEEIIRFGLDYMRRNYETFDE